MWFIEDKCRNNHLDLCRRLAKKDLELWYVTSWTWVSNAIAVRTLFTEIKTPCYEKRSSHIGCAACRSPDVILLLRFVPETCVKLLWLVWGTELQGKRWGDWVDLTWGCLPWRRFSGGAIIGFKKSVLCIPGARSLNLIKCQVQGKARW